MATPRFYWVFMLTAVLFPSCATLEAPGNPGGIFRSALGERVVSAALGLQGQIPDARVTVDGKDFTLDCVGTVSAAYWGAGVDIRSDFHRYDGNGVTRLFKTAAGRNSLSLSIQPEPGDLIFWENTWDRNEDGIVGNDGPTHAGLVIRVDGDGTIHYLHEDYVKGVVMAVMNLHSPEVYKDAQGKMLNSPLFMGSYPGNPKNPPRFLSGQLWLGFGNLRKLAEVLEHSLDSR